MPNGVRRIWRTANQHNNAISLLDLNMLHLKLYCSYLQINERACSQTKDIGRNPELSRIKHTQMYVKTTKHVIGVERTQGANYTNHEIVVYFHSFIHSSNLNVKVCE